MGSTRPWSFTAFGLDSKRLPRPRSPLGQCPSSVRLALEMEIHGVGGGLAARPALAPLVPNRLLKPVAAGSAAIYQGPQL